MDGLPATVFWREIVSDGRASSYLVTECRTPAVDAASDSPAVDELVRVLAMAFFEGVLECSGGLFAASYQVQPSLGGGQPLISDAALHPRGLPWLPVIRLGHPRLWRSQDHAFLVYPVAGGPLAGRRASAPVASGEAVPLVATGPDLPTAPGVPPGSGVWDLGALGFEVLRFGGTLSLSVLVCDYPPRLIGSGRSLTRNAFYRLTQSPVHRLLVGRFLQGAAAQVTRPPVQPPHRPGR